MSSDQDLPRIGPRALPREFIRLLAPRLVFVRAPGRRARVAHIVDPWRRAGTACGQDTKGMETLTVRRLPAEEVCGSCSRIVEPDVWGEFRRTGPDLARETDP